MRFRRKKIVIKSPKKLFLGKNVAINEFVYINACGTVWIGNNSLIAPFVMIHSGNHNYENKFALIQDQGHRLEQVTIGDDCWIGSHTTVLYGTHIPDGVVIGACSLVTRNDNLDPYCVYVGNPLRFLKKRLGWRTDGL